ncbi:hypothetical protein ABZX90_04155 [Streptomyces sp. NPDC002935]|uniref:hypothetical protein n=1 Tax=Streptomyces sp. NPDC002935 TaxID=3154545 RepID=UPI0033ADFCA8
MTREPAAKTLRVEDGTGRVTVEVPAGWGGQLRGSGWNPRTLGLEDGAEPGLAVANRLARWQDLGSGVDGAFVGLSEHGDLTGEVRAIAHTGCHYAGSRAYSSTRWHGLIRTWDDCSGEDGSLTEAALTAAGGAGQPQVYVQIRQESGDDDTADGVIGSVRVEP